MANLNVSLCTGWGEFMVQASYNESGWLYSKFFFQASFATTATTIVSGEYPRKYVKEVKLSLGVVQFSIRVSQFIHRFSPHSMVHMNNSVGGG